MSYEYILDDNLKSPLRYQYTEYRGTSFMRDWYASRRWILDQIDVTAAPEKLVGIQRYNLMDARQGEWLSAETSLQTLLCILLRNEELSNEQKHTLDGFVKTFEVRKRLYSHYTAGFKPGDETDYCNMTLYTGFACVCAAAFAQYNDLRYLNALLKVNDTLLSQWERRGELKELTNQRRLAYSVKKELEFVFNICRARGVVWGEP